MKKKSYHPKLETDPAFYPAGSASANNGAGLWRGLGLIGFAYLCFLSI